MGEVKKHAVALTLTKQTGYDTYQDYIVIKLFGDSDTFANILEWAKTQKKDITISEIRFAELTT